MIKEKKRKTKYNAKKPTRQIISEYVRTIGFSFLFALIVTSALAYHARQEMIKNLYINPIAQHNIDKQMALQLINSGADMMKDLSNKRYMVCMNVGSLYETAEDFITAEVAYRMAVSKSKKDNFKAHLKLVEVMLAQEKYHEAEELISGIEDYTSKNLIKFKTRAYIVLGDKYYSIGKFLSAAKCYEKANFYYSKFSKRDKKIDEAIRLRLINSYIHTADEIVKMDKNSDAVRFLRRAEALAPDDLKIKYKLAIILSDLDPEEAVKYLKLLLKKAPQDIDYNIFGTALMKAANIADLDGRPTVAKAYRYKIHSIDMFLNRKVVYKNDIDVILDPTPVKKILFTYPVSLTYKFLNNSANDIKFLNGDFVLSDGENPIETYTTIVADKENPLLSGGMESNDIKVKFRKKILTKKELSSYTVKIYLYKDEKFKTLVAETKIPVR